MTIALGIAGALPPTPGGPADYLAGLLPALVQRARVTCFVTDPDKVEPALRSALDVRPLSERHSADVDLHCYHIANNPWQLPYDAAALDGPPGLAVVHDGSLHHQIGEELRESGDAAAYADALAESHGRAGADLADLRLRGYGGEVDLSLFDTLAPVLSRQLGAVVHSDYARRLVQRQVPGLPVWTIPHYSIGQPQTKSREELGLPGGLLIGHLGLVTPPKRPELLLQAFARVRAAGVGATLVFAGECDPASRVEAEVERLGLGDSVMITGFLSEDDLDACAAAFDVVVSLRWPHVAETSGTLMRALRAGRTVVVEAVGTWAELPDDAVVKIPAADGEGDALAETLVALATDTVRRELVGARAAAYAASIGGPDESAASLLDAATELLATERVPPREFGRRHADAVDEFLAGGLHRIADALGHSGSIHAYSQVSLDDHRLRYLETLRHLPVAHPNARLLDIGSIPALLRVLAAVWGYEVRACGHGVGEPRQVDLPASAGLPGFTAQYDPVDVETQRFPYDAGSFDVVTCWEVIEHLGRDPMHMLWEINRVLKPGGVLLLTTPNVASLRALRSLLAGGHPYLWSQFHRSASPDRHNREYTPDEIRVMLRASGLSDDGVGTHDVWGNYGDDAFKRFGASSEDRGDIIVALARKVSLPNERHPAALYR